MEEFNLLRLALNFPNVFDNICSYLTFVESGLLFNILSTFDGFAKLYDFQGYHRKQLLQMVKDGNQCDFLPGNEKMHSLAHVVCVKNKEVFVLDDGDSNTPYRSIKVFRKGLLVDVIDIKDMIMPLFKLRNHLEVYTVSLQEHFIILYLDPDGMGGGARNMLIPRDPKARKKKSHYFKPESVSYHIHDWTMWFIVKAIPMNSLEIRKQILLSCHEVSLAVDETQPCPLENGVPIWETHVEVQKSKAHLLFERVGSSFGLHFSINSYKDSKVTSDVTVVRHVDGRIQAFEPPWDLHSSGIDILGDNLIMLSQYSLVIIEGKSLTVRRNLRLDDLDISCRMNISIKRTNSWIVPEWLCFGIKDDSDDYVLNLIRLNDEDLAGSTQQVRIKKPQYAMCYERTVHTMPVRIISGSVCFVGRSSICLIMKIESVIYENALVLVHLYDDKEPIVWSPVYCKEGDIRQPLNLGLSGLYED